MASAEDTFGLEGQVLEGRFRIDQAVAGGGFGVVYRAMHTALGKPIAIKVLRAPEHPDPEVRTLFLEGFSREARTLARLEHPAIVHVVDFGVSTMPSGVSTPWMALEWLDGQTLAEELQAQRGKGGRSPAECLKLLAPICEALASAHAQGVVHRDVKPDNILILRAPLLPGAVPARLVDFGIAKVMHPEEASGSGQTATRSAKVAFSLPYASPEQISHTRTGPWTDVHALGLILTEMLADRAPFRGRDAVEFHQQILAPVRPTPARFDLDAGAWEPVLQRALALRPADRYPDAGALLDALRAEVPAEVFWKAPNDTLIPERHPPSAAPAEIIAPAKRNRWIAPAALAALVAAVAVVRASTAPPPAPAPSATPAPSVAPAPTVPVAPITPVAEAPAAPTLAPPAPAARPVEALVAHGPRPSRVTPTPAVVAPASPAPVALTTAATAARARRVHTE